MDKRDNLNRTKKSSQIPPRKRDALIQHAVQQLEHLNATGAVTGTSEMRKTLALFLNKLIEDNQPNPQMGPSSTGGIEIVWLVGGNHLTLIIDDEGEWLIWGENAEGQEYLDEEKQPNQNEPSVEAISIAKGWLTEMGKNVRYPIPYTAPPKE